MGGACGGGGDECGGGGDGRGSYEVAVAQEVERVSW